jgi:Copper type II ascorbate-dependent monooxygenase, C-terminal domain./Copper type II ascorbate-dependent monooxygenase, N-terminal domain.
VDDSIPFVSHHKIIGAWGDSPTIFYHGNNRVQSSIQFFPNNEQVTGTPPGTGQEERSDNVYNVFLSEMNRRSEGYVDLILDSYNVLLQRTRYENVCFSQANLTDFGLPLVTEDGINSKLYLVGYEFLIPTMCTKYLHHIVVYGMTAAFNTNPNKCSFISSNPAFGWTPGEDFAYFPDNSGIALGGTSGFNAFISQYHFDNKDMDAGVSCDGSGVRMYFTTQPQEHEIGTVQIGDPLVGLKGMKIGKGFTEHTFDCPSTCSDYMFSGAPGGKVTVIGETLHMHSLGKKIVNQVVRNGRVIHEAKSDFWDFAQTGLKAVQQRPYTLQTGDQFLTTCFYKASDTDVFGFGSHEEMCMAFLFYFPRQDSILASTCGTNPDLKYYIPKCFASHNSKALDSVDDLGRTFGSLLPLGGTGGKK